MKKSLSIAAMLLLLISITAQAATDRSYYVTELAVQSKMDIYNDGKNTYIENVPGLVITGATADGNFYIISGIPSTIRGFMNGKPITVLRGAPPVIAKPSPPAISQAEINAKINKLNDELGRLAVAEARRTAQPIVSGGASLQGAGGTAAVVSIQGAPVALPRANTAFATMVWKTDASDGNLRSLIERWSRTVGWNPLWEVERDIPITSSDEMTGDFKAAVRRVLLSTEFGDVQLKPCFHTNKVVRIVRKTTKCNPSE